MLRPLLQHAHARGVDTAELAAAAGLSVAQLEDSEQRLNHQHTVRLWEAAATALQDPSLGLHVAAEVNKDSFDLFSQVAAVSGSYREVIGRLERFGRLVSPVPLYELRETEDTAALVSRAFPGRGCARSLCEFVVCVAWAYARQWSEGPRMRRAWFDHAAPDDLGCYEAFFGVPVEFGQRDAGFEFDRRKLDVSLGQADPGLGQMLERYADAEVQQHAPPEDLQGRLRAHLQGQLAGGDLGLSAAARALAMSERSLQRGLVEEGVRFQEVLDAQRRELALGYVADQGLALDEVAFRLGFSSATAFGRAFKRWTGRSPSAYREGLD